MRIAVLAFTPFAEDGRVQRTVQALAEAGHDVLVVARRPFPADFTGRRCELPAPAAPLLQRALLVAREAPATLIPQLGRPLYWLSRQRRAALAAALAFRPDLVLCNDWLTLPIGAAVKRRLGAKLVYDSHEFATREHVQNWKWRLVSHRAVQVLEAASIGAADLVVTVSGGIAAALAALYRLPATPLVIRNLPPYQATAFRPARRPTTVLFHGLIRQERGLEDLIDSMPAWTFPGRTVIRGYGPEGYATSLAERARRLGVGDRVAFEPRVSPHELVRAAAAAEIGYLVLPDTTEHYEFALPNKLFEYMMAGLAVAASPRAEIAAILRETGAGRIVEPGPGGLAATLNAIDPASLDTMRRAALDAARTLNWENERTRLVRAVADLAGR